MLGWTDRHCRYLLRLISRKALLYTEMVHSGAILYGEPTRFLAHHPDEHPLALQLGGSCPRQLAAAAALGQAYGYDEINLNVGCPSSRVQAGLFGACLMAQPGLVAECVAAMRAAVSIPVTVKTRIGIDAQDSYEALAHFIDVVQQSGCQRFIIHARKAWLHGLNPKQNRTVPPLRYDYVYRLKHDFPQLTIVLNGGLHAVDDLHHYLSSCDGVMIGRQAYDDPYTLSIIDNLYYGVTDVTPTRHQIVQQYMLYVQQQLALGVQLKHMARHVLNLFHGQLGAKAWRRHLSAHMHVPTAGVEVITGALRYVCASS